MAYDNLPGSFGSNRNRETKPQFDDEPQHRQRKQRQSKLDLSLISPERWVDIVCCSLIAIFLIVVLCNWSAFSDALFQNILFPIIDVGSKIMAIVTAVGVGIGVICAKIRRRRRRFWW